MNKTNASTHEHISSVADAHTLPPSPMVQQLKPAPTKLYRVEEVARELSCSLSYVYALIAKHKPSVMATDGRAYLYSSDFVDEMKAIPRRHRQSKVKLISPKTTNPSSTVAKEQHQQKNLLARITDLEHNVSKMTESLHLIKQALGI